MAVTSRDLPGTTRTHPLTPLLTAQAETMQAALDHIAAHYGSIEGYLRNAAGLGDDAITQLRSQLLVEG